MRAAVVILLLGLTATVSADEPDVTSPMITNAEINFLMRKKIEVTEELMSWKEYTDNVAMKGHLMLKMTEIIATRANLSLQELSRSEKQKLLFKTVLVDICKPEVNCSDRLRVSRYRTIDGFCNNLNHPTLGMTGRQHKRQLPATYTDVIGSPRRHGVGGHVLPSPRVISNVVHRPDVDNVRDPHATVMVMAFGQFLDHDFGLTPTFKAADTTGLSCCGTDRDEVSGPAEVCHPIGIYPDDPHFGQYNITCMNFVRSVPAVCDSCEPCGRHPMNAASSYIDAGHVYGLSTSEADSLRSFKKGLMKMVGNMLPSNPSRKSCDVKHPTQYCLAAGDPRVNVVPNLSALHLTFVREHNRLATRLADLNPEWDDERLYQDTRRIVIAVFQHITYFEYLPIVLGEYTMRKYGLEVSGRPHIDGYDANKDATLGVGFSTAAFRFGHSSITNIQGCLDREYKMDFRNNIEDTYKNPNLTFTAATGLTRWMSFDEASPTDGAFEAGVRNLLFAKKSHASLDLSAVNIQRGRDHGVPPYNEWRAYCGLPVIDAGSFGKTGAAMGHFTAPVADKFRNAYRHPDDIDLFAGASRETTLEGAQVGPTFACMLGEAFHGLKYGDRFYYEFGHRDTATDIRFTTSQLKAIKNYRLSKILCENNHVETMQTNVFKPHNMYSNHMKDCSAIDDLDLQSWIEDTSGGSTIRYSCLILISCLIVILI